MAQRALAWAAVALVGLAGCTARPQTAAKPVSDDPPRLARPEGWTDTQPPVAGALADWTLGEPVALRVTLTRTPVPGLSESRLAPKLAETLTRDVVARWRALGYSLADSVTATVAGQNCHVLEARLAGPEGGVWQKQYLFPRQQAVYVLSGTAPAAAEATAEPVLERLAESLEWRGRSESERE